jgi:hypothetical protein
MSEHLPTSANSERPEEQPERRYPSEDELREFEAYQRRYANDAYTTIEDFARDSENPTTEEISAVEYLNRANRLLKPLSFEDYFGYPDPRTSESRDNDQTN